MEVLGLPRLLGGSMAVSGCDTNGLIVAISRIDSVCCECEIVGAMALIASVRALVIQPALKKDTWVAISEETVVVCEDWSVVGGVDTSIGMVWVAISELLLTV